MVTDVDRIDDICDELIKKFDEVIKNYYTQEDRNRGYIITKDRLNNTITFPMMTLSIAVVFSNKKSHYAKIVEKAFEIKRFLKARTKKDKSVYHKDRRINE